VSVVDEYLKAWPLYWINLDRSEDRARAMMETVTPMFATATRVHAVDGTTEVLDSEAIDFVDEWRRMWASRSERLTAANKPPGENPRLQTQKSNVAIKRSHQRALSFGIDQGLAGFFVAEDDIVPRSTLADVPLPPGDAEVAIWSGGLPMASVRTDDDVFAAGRPHTWVRIEGKDCFNCLGAGLYQVTRAAAQHLLGVTSCHPMSWDHSWGFALQGLVTYRLRPNAFAQAGESVRNGKVRKPVVVR